MDAGSLGMFTAAVMEQIEERFGDEAVLRTVAVVAEVDTGPATEILVTCDDDRPWMQIAFLHEAVDSLEARLAAMLDED
jgi:hypothetical protein